MLTAITRPVSASLADCELTHLPRVRIDMSRAAAQHAEYEKALTTLGAKVIRLPATPELPDAVFVEDTAVVLDEVAVITRPGAASRRGETAAVAAALGEYRSVYSLEEPATLDGGDVLRIGRTLYVGKTSRTNAAGIDQLGKIVGVYGFRVVPVEVTGCLHLKSAATVVDEDMMLVNPAWVPIGIFREMEKIAVDPAEPHGANGLAVGNGLIYPAHFPRTRERLWARGLKVTSVDMSELAKAEGAVSCCCLLFASRRGSV